MFAYGKELHAWLYSGRVGEQPRFSPALVLAAAAFVGRTAESLCEAPCDVSSPSKAEVCAEMATGAVVDVAVIGGGVVGLAVARELAVRGNSVTVLERSPGELACVMQDTR